ncbi:hypothetical protein GC169_13565 [bacterium]|nr:hypothetical protein [bacterium]
MATKADARTGGYPAREGANLRSDKSGLGSPLAAALAVAAVIGLTGLTGAAGAQAVEARAAPCSPPATAIYFDRESDRVSDLSQALVKRVAAEASACGARVLMAEAPTGGLKDARLKTLAGLFARHGVTIIPASGVRPMRGDDAEAVSERRAMVRPVPGDVRTS